MKQLEELISIVEKFSPAIVTGDFNIKNLDDFKAITEPTGLELQVPGKSFSTAHPVFNFDVFLTSPQVGVERCETIPDVDFSDHLPIILEIS